MPMLPVVVWFVNAVISAHKPNYHPELTLSHTIQFLSATIARSNMKPPMLV